jgi:hypothetical protein
MATISNVGWIKDPRLVEQTIDSCKTEQASDRYLSRFLLQMRYARPSSVESIGNPSSRIIRPTFMDGFLTAVRQIGYNQLLEVTDACTAKICQQLRPKVVPVASKPDIVRLCTLLNRLIDGVLETCDFLAEQTSAWEDTYCCPIGAVLFEIEEKTREIRCGRINPLHAYWHRQEGRNPIHFYYEEFLPREVVLERWPDFEREIMSAPRQTPEHILGVDPPSVSTVDTIRVCRAWRRKMGAEDGRYVVSINRNVVNGDGEGEPWAFDFFPLAISRCRWDFSGFGGVPMGRYIAPHHMAINRLARIAEDSFKAAVPRWSSHASSKCNEISDVPVSIMKWEGSVEPKLQSTNPVSDQVLARIDYHDAKSYAIGGINKSIAQGQAPNGVVAAVAMREVQALADARANEYEKHWENSYEQAGHIVVAFAHYLKKVHVRSKSDANAELMEEIDVRSIALDKNDYRVSYGVSSALSKTIPGLLSDLQEFKDLGLVDMIDVAQAIGDKVPDLAAVVDRVTSHKRLAAKMVQDALERGEIPVPPSASMGQQGLDAIIILGQQAWCSSMLTPDRYTPEGREALRRLMRISAAKKAPPAPPAPTVAPAQPIPQGSLVGVGTPGSQRIAHNQYEAASMGVAPGGQPPAPGAPPAPPAPQAAQ